MVNHGWFFLAKYCKFPLLCAFFSQWPTQSLVKLWNIILGMNQVKHFWHIGESCHDGFQHNSWLLFCLFLSDILMARLHWRFLLRFQAQFCGVYWRFRGDTLHVANRRKNRRKNRQCKRAITPHLAFLFVIFFPIYLDKSSWSTCFRLFKEIFHRLPWLSGKKNPGQTDSQVDASFVWPPSCVDLDRLATTCVDLRHKLIASNLLL